MATYELGRVEGGAAPVFRDGVPVVTLAASNWRERATATVGGNRWLFTRRGRELLGRWEAEPEGGVPRLAARQDSWWRSTWSLALEGTEVAMTNLSVWRGTHRYAVGGRTVAESGWASRWGVRPTLTADDAMPLAHAVFLLWLEVVVARRAAAAAS
jgi:hypothetical protein